MKHVFLAIFIVFLASGVSWSQSQPSGALQGSNLLNPNISVIGWFQGEAGHRQLAVDAEAPPAFQFKEAEVSFQSVVDPYARADYFVSIGKEGANLEEGYISWFHLPYDLSLKAGKIKAGFGRFNTNHSHNIAFADRPLVHDKYFGEEGIADAGGALSWHVPNPWLFVDLDAEVLNMPKAKDVPAFDKAQSKDLLYIGRLSGYYDLTEELNTTIGGSYAHGTAGQEFNAVRGSSTTLESQLYGTDITLRWKNPRRAIYQSVIWQTEVLWNKREISNLASVYSMGLFTHLEYQFAQRWKMGGRWDWSQSPTNGSQHDQGQLVYLTFTPSEFSLISLQGKEVKKADGSNESLGFLRVTFNIGPHGAHPF